MTIQTINIGTTANDGTGDPLRTALDKVNDNFTDVTNAASYSVTANTTDSSTGDNGQPRLMRVGDFGVGDIIVRNGLSLKEDFLPQGEYLYLNGSDLPLGWGASNWFVSRTGADDILSDTVKIEASELSTGRTYFSNRSGGTWSPWQEILHTGNMVGTVSQSGGSPTGAIIERGSNANGEYVKFADGTMECWYTTPIINPVDMTVQGSLHNFGSWAFPAAFLSGTKATVTVSGSHNGASTAGAQFAAACLANSNISATQITIQHIAAGQNLSVWAHFRAIGRWY